MPDAAYRCPQCHNQLVANARFCGVCGLDVSRDQPQYAPAPQTQPLYPYQPAQAPQGMPAYNILRRIHDYQKLSGIFWIGLGVLQIMSICVLFFFGIPVALVGVWNIFAGISRIQVAPRILAGDASIPHQFNSLTGLIVIGLLNLTMGGMLGVVMVVFDFIIRDQILSNQHLFQNAPVRA